MQMQIIFRFSSVNNKLNGIHIAFIQLEQPVVFIFIRIWDFDHLHDIFVDEHIYGCNFFLDFFWLNKK